jgi:hypothetical protein
MGRESILTNARVAAGIEQVILEPTLNHPPTNDTLEADHAADADELQRHGRGDLLARDEVGGGQQERDANDSAPQAVRPLHEVDLLEFRESHT